MNNIIPPYFTRLYSLLFFAVFASALTTFVLVSRWESVDAVDDFNGDVMAVYQQLEQIRGQREQSVDVFYRQVESFVMPFNLKVVHQASPDCLQCEYLATIDQTRIYAMLQPFDDGHSDGEIQDEDALTELEEIGMLALVALDTGLYLQVSDLEENDDFTGHDPGPDVEAFQMPMLLAVICVAIGMVLLIPLRQLQRDITVLSRVSSAFGQGELTARAIDINRPPLQTLASAFNQMADGLATRINESQVFAQAVPHELRTPLSRIQLATGLLRKQSLNEQSSELVDDIDRYIEDIDALCSDVIQLSSLNDPAKKGEVVLTDVGQFVRSRLAALPETRHHAVTVTIADDLSVSTIPLNLRLIIDNLIKNACCYGRHAVHISAEKLSDTSDHPNTNHSAPVRWMLTIEDDGPGIPVEKRADIFLPYARLDDSRSRRTGGLGLGLAIVERSVKQLGGEIGVTEGRSGGARFWVRFDIQDL